ncbi:hypothetical protein K8W59_17555 [Nocardioides rotundus]|uniref:hypothetical protein n=1 Tax=Nocardioides rotundus TaxID=1774216 RepID=UPI001CC00389|nr:hypothetical protein [Nocardioides rotundus]UAL29534.1 hypothetical protein K8W59_17555 [Nocardioides rotundus]
MSNLYDRPSADIPDLLADDGTPRDFITKVLRAAHTPEEAERLLARYRHAAAAGEPFVSQGIEDTPEGVVAEVAVLAMGLPTPSCGCS